MKIFTVQEANALLPEVRIIAGKIQRAHRKLAQFRDEAKEAAEAAEHANEATRRKTKSARVNTGRAR